MSDSEGLWGGKPIKQHSGLQPIPTADALLEKSRALAAARNGEAVPVTESDEKPVNVDMLFDFDDHVAAMKQELGGRDKNSWALGRIASHFLITVGRPTNEDKENEVPTLADLAEHAGCSKQRLSEWRNNYAYWTDMVRVSVGLEGVTWSHYNLARRHVADDESKRPLAVALLRTAIKRHYSEELFGDYLGNLRFYTKAVRDAFIPPLDEQHLTIARKASAGVLANAEELLSKAKDMGLDVAAFRQYCAGFKPGGCGGMGGGHSTQFVIPDSVTWGDSYYDALRELLPDDVKAGDTFTITVTRD